MSESGKEPRLKQSPEGLPVASPVRDEVVKAYYPALLASADGVRQRAHNAFAISSAVGTGLAAAGLLGNLETETQAVQIAALLALAGWLTAAGLYLFAVAGATDPETQGDLGADEFVYAAINNVTSERETLRRRAGRALCATTVALILTLIAAVSVVATSREEREAAGMLILTDEGVRDVRRACPAATRTMPAKLHSSALADELVPTTVSGNVCDKRAVKLVIRRDSIAAFRKDD